MSGIAQYGANLDALYQTFNAAFEEGLNDTKNRFAQPWWSRLAMEIPSDTDTEVHAWIQQVPEVREWLGDRIFNTIGEAAYSLRNKDFENTVKVSRNRVFDRKISAEAALMSGLGYSFRKFADRRIAADLMVGYGSLTCFDGLSFFNDSHPVDVLNAGAGTFDNLRTSTALTAANFETVYAAMSGFQDTDGKPIGIVPDLLVVPPALRSTAMLITQADLVPSTAGTASQTNMNKGLVDVLVVPELASEGTTWYLFATKGPLKPFIYQRRTEPVLELLLGLDSEHCKKKKEIVYGADCRAAFGYTLPQLGVRCTA